MKSDRTKSSLECIEIPGKSLTKEMYRNKLYKSDVN